MDIFQLSLAYCAFVVFTNISLQANSIKSHTVFRMAMIPTVVAMEAYWIGRRVSSDLLLTLVSNLLMLLLNRVTPLQHSSELGIA